MLPPPPSFPPLIARAGARLAPSRQARFGAALRQLEEQRRADRDVLTPSKAGALTPLEKQVVELKRQHPDCLLAIEVGYKYMFYAEDAQAASEALSIVAYRKQHLLCAGVPTQRLHIHLRRLVEAGHKVGVVRQTETSALKAAAGPSCAKSASRPVWRALF